MMKSLGRAARSSTITHRPSACARSKRALRVSGGAGRAGNVRGVRGVVWYDGRRVSAFEGPAAHPLLKCTATSGDLSRPRESQDSCKRGEGSEGITEVNGHLAGKCMCGTRAHEGQGPRVIPIPAAQLAAAAQSGSSHSARVSPSSSIALSQSSEGFGPPAPKLLP